MKKSFTLIEVLVSTVIFSIIMIVFIVALRAVMQPRSKAQAVGGVQKAANSAMETIVSSIDRANTATSNYVDFAITNTSGVANTTSYEGTRLTTAQDPYRDGRVVIKRAFELKNQDGSYHSGFSCPEGCRLVMIQSVDGSPANQPSDVLPADTVITYLKFRGYYRVKPDNDLQIAPYMTIALTVKSKYTTSESSGSVTIKSTVRPVDNVSEVAPPTPADGYAYLFNGDTKLGYFFSVSGQTSGDLGEYIKTSYYYIDSLGEYIHGRKVWGEWNSCFGESHINCWDYVELNRVRQGNSEWSGSVRVLGNAGNLLGYLHVLREDPSGTFAYNGLKLKDEGRFVDSSAAAVIYDDNECYALSGAIRKDYGGSDSAMVDHVGRKGYGPNQYDTRKTFAHAIENYLSVTNKLHFLVVDETRQAIIGKLTGESNGVILGEFSGSSESCENEFWPQCTLYVPATGTSCVDFQMNDRSNRCVNNFKTTYPNFRYRLVP